ncbi:hypothetical protein FA13DRAFT_1743623, partial [Coprinellus micaceus]
WRMLTKVDSSGKRWPTLGNASLLTRRLNYDRDRDTAVNGSWLSTPAGNLLYCLGKAPNRGPIAISCSSRTMRKSADTWVDSPDESIAVGRSQIGG